MATSLLCLMVLLAGRTRASAATLPELRSQLAAAERGFATVYAAKVAMVDFTNNYAGNAASLQQAYTDLQNQETTLRTLLRNNLVKSTILLGYDTFKTINDAASLGSSTVTGLVGDGLSHAVKNYAWDQFKDGLTGAAKDKMGIGDQDEEDARSPYTVHIRSLKASTLAIMPDIKNVQTILRMSLEDVKARALHDDGSDLDQTGCIYRKYQMLLDGIAQAQTGLYQMRSQVAAAQQSMVDQLPQVEAERVRLGELCTNLRNQIGVLHATEQSSIASATESNYYSPVTLTVQDLNVTQVPPETLEEFLLRRKRLVEAYVAQQFPGYKSQSDSLAAEIDQKLAAFTNQYGLYFHGHPNNWAFAVQYTNQYCLALGNDRETLDVATVSTVLGIVRNHKLIKDACDGLVAAAGPAASLLVQADADLVALLDVYENLRTVDANVSELYQIGGAASSWVPEPFNWPAGIEGYRDVSTALGVSAVISAVGIVRDQQTQAAAALVALNARRKNYEAAVEPAGTNGVQSVYAMELAECQNIQELLTQCEQARPPLLACAAEYNQLIGQNRFLSQRPYSDDVCCSAGAYWDGAGLLSAFKYFYSQYYFQEALSSALAATNGHTGADPLWFAYDGVVNSYREINRRYSEAFTKYMQLYTRLEHYYSGVSFPMVALDLAQAAVADGYLAITAPDLSELTRRFQAVGGIKGYELGDLPVLPDTENDITTLAAYRVYQLKKKVALDGPGWLTLWPAEFDAQYRQCTNESAAIRALFGFVCVEGWDKANAEMSALNTQYDLVNPPPLVTDSPRSPIIANGSRVTFALGATCPNSIAYQWYWGAVNDFSNPIPFANSPAYTTPAIASNQTFNCFATLSSRCRTPHVIAGGFSVIMDPMSIGGPGGPPTNSMTQPFNTLSNWAATCNLPADKQGANDDPARIGVPNRIAYALGIDPYGFSPQQLPELTVAANQMEMRFNRPANTIGYVYAIQSSVDLVQWNTETLTKVSETSVNETWAAILSRTNAMRFLRFVLK